MKRILLSATMVLLLAGGCARVFVPPAVDLKPHEMVGIVTFKPSVVSTGLAALTTQKFVEAVTDDQPGIRLVELGDEAAVLAAAGQTAMGPDAYRAIAERYGVKTLFLGELNISDIQPKISIGPGLAFASFEAEVNATLVCRLVEGGTSATLWSNSATERRTVGGISKWGSSFAFNAEDPDNTYGALARSLTRKATRDFRQTWRCRCCGSK